MSTTENVRHLAERGRTPLLAVVGAGDLAVERARAAVDELRARAEALPGEAQVQVDLATKEARTRAEEATARARAAAQALRPEVVVSTVTGLVEDARNQAAATIETLAERGAEVLEELRRQPGFRRVVRRAEHAVDTVEDALEDVLEETAEVVSEASDEVTSLAQKTAAKTTKVVEQAERATAEAADSAKAAVREVEEAPIEDAPSTPGQARRTGAQRKATPARGGRARTAKRTDPTAVPAKNDG